MDYQAHQDLKAGIRASEAEAARHAHQLRQAHKRAQIKRQHTAFAVAVVIIAVIAGWVGLAP